MNYQDLDLIVLKHILTSKKHALEFVSESNEKIFSADIWRFTKIILDYIRLYRELPTRNVINEKNKTNNTLVKYINTIWDDVEKVNIDEREYKHNLEKLRNKFAERLIYRLKDNLIPENGVIDLKKSISELHAVNNHLKEINQVKAYEQKSIKESLNDIRERYVLKQKNPSYGAGLKTGIRFFDNLTNGLMPSEMLIVCGPTAGGKSILLSQIAQSIWLGDNTIDTEKDFLPGSDVVYFSLEMPMQHCLERLCANLAKVPQVGIRDAKLNDEEKQRMGKALKFIERYPNELIIVDAPRGTTPESLELIYNDIVEERGKKPAALVIDYLALMSYNDDDLDDWLLQGKLSEKVAEIGRVNNINVITAAQMTDDDKNKPGVGSMGTHRLSRSRMIGHNANFIMMIEKRANEQHRPDFILHLVKSRRSALAVGTLYKNLECCALLNEPLAITNELTADNGQDISDNVE